MESTVLYASGISGLKIVRTRHRRAVGRVDPSAVHLHLRIDLRMLELLLKLD